MLGRGLRCLVASITVLVRYFVLWMLAVGVAVLVRDKRPRTEQVCLTRHAPRRTTQHGSGRPPFWRGRRTNVPTSMLVSFQCGPSAGWAHRGS
jgi:hypothetical protein